MYALKILKGAQKDKEKIKQVSALRARVLLETAPVSFWKHTLVYEVDETQKIVRSISMRTHDEY